MDGNSSALNSTVSRNLTDNVTTHHEPSIISEETYELMSFVTYSVILPVIATVGLVGNALAVGVLARTAKQLRQSVYIYMCALTITDALYMIIILFRSGPNVLKNFNPVLANKLDAYTLPYSIAGDLALNSIAVLIIILMSIERYIAVTKPLAVRGTTIARHPLPLILACAVVVIAIVIPLPFCMHATVVTEEDNATMYVMDVRSDMENFFDVYVLVETILLYYVPFFLVLPLNIAIAYGFHKVSKRRKQNFFNIANVSSQQMRVMATVFAIMIMYTLCTLPQISVQTLSVIDTRFSLYGTQRNLFFFLQDLANILVTFNAATDFVVYILMSKTYRARFAEQFCCKCETRVSESDISVYALSVQD